MVLSRSGGAGIQEEEDGVVVSESLDAALALLASGEYAEGVERVFVIGGGQVYRLESIFCLRFWFFFRILHILTFSHPHILTL